MEEKLELIGASGNSMTWYFLGCLAGLYAFQIIRVLSQLLWVPLSIKEIQKEALLWMIPFYMDILNIIKLIKKLTK